MVLHRIFVFLLSPLMALPELVAGCSPPPSHAYYLGNETHTTANRTYHPMGTVSPDVAWSEVATQLRYCQYFTIGDYVVIKEQPRSVSGYRFGRRLVISLNKGRVRTKTSTIV
ncbi:hypothetical protein C7974DRAFT_208165 [Boeremia exigua]|uniref:uncharacterized protein n=1 Tax=Boeremia exigua TaxID=749465 RepID=UPI001E8E305C|nr:uncharacterized protein C7974DRAFT_208165 [Boeremia exigua]KAH6625828.1 hypothetical protein C7974DRAFT_208165 [Boeremia exigua]